MIIIDTGSQDQTKKIAEQYSASIFDFRWNSNFSEARNASLRRATSDWILYLDADERIENENRQLLQSLISANDVDAYMVNVKSYLDETDTYMIDWLHRHLGKPTS